MNDLHGFHPGAFVCASSESDTAFWSTRPSGPMLDAGACTAVTALYRTMLPEGGRILDLMAGSDSHLPADVPFDEVIGIGVEAPALEANGRLTQRIVQDLNETPELPLADESLDAVCLCDVVPYLRQPVALFRETARVLQPGGLVLVTYGNGFVAQKAVALWQALETDDRQRLVRILMQRGGFEHTDTGSVAPPPNDAVWHDTIYGVTARREGDIV
ncbi:class I SAM-dependent methyltransferase [Novacetimonas pomaceti]|uniref:SAM-dependent methyltransferase n=1 Tax=Novacetimonas pomaceti TaxID=2021998 RepID=A0ABX5PAW3_9PROT|nr:methyltransferase domain-containing protein [Novacetimonas pomaceti]MBV1832748.1 class I SAM-dependent methyltransferase [Novacetimonas pomaceti]PYD49048.1 SAM-dependent methyltransferase [Novacetimonas pomaceti]